jgi:hypothetical protein
VTNWEIKKHPKEEQSNDLRSKRSKKHHNKLMEAKEVEISRIED